MKQRSSFSYPLLLLLQTLLIAGFTRIGILFSFVESDLSQIWSPAGLSIMTVFLFGVRIIPAVFAGTLVNYLVIVPDTSMGLILAFGSSIEAVIGAAILKRLSFDPALKQLKQIGILVVAAGAAGTAVNAILSAAVYEALTPHLHGTMLTHAVLWWLGNLVGVVVIAPVVSLIAARPESFRRPNRETELIILVVTTAVLSYTIYHANFFSSVLNFSFAFILFPFGIIAALRHGLPGAVITIFVIALNATLSTQTALGLFAAESYTTSIVLVDVFLLLMGTTTLALASLIEERSAVEQQVRLSEERYRIVTEQTGQLVYDYHVDSGIIYWSGAVNAVLGLQPEEFAGVNIKGWLERIHPEERAEVEREMLDSMRSRREFRMEYRFRRKEGTYADVLDRGAFLYRQEGDIVAQRMLGTMADISVIKAAERRLKESEERYRLFSELASDYIYSAVVDGAVLRTEWSSDKFLAITGYTIDEVNREGGWTRLVHPEDAERAMTEATKVYSGIPMVVEYRIITKTGSVKWLRDYIRPIADPVTGTVTRLYGGVQDITERKSAEERFRILIERIADGIMLFDKRGMITFMSPSAVNIIGYPVHELVGTSIFTILHPSEAKKYAFKFGRLTVEYDRTEQLFGRFLHKDGRWVYIEGMVTNLFGNPSVNAFVANFRNVTDRVMSEEQMRRSLEEKEVLLKEVHHRVKNNMQVISSLLNLQSAAVKDPAVETVFRESRNRLKSMALVHEILYRSGDLADVDFKEYVRQLVSSLQKSYGAKSDGITVRVKVSSVRLNIDASIPCGLIVNELVSNAIKYAFPRRRSGEIDVEMKRRRSGEYRLTVRDNGIGTAQRSEGSSALGLTLVRALTEQLKGTIEIGHDRGTIVSVEFSVNHSAHA